MADSKIRVCRGDDMKVKIGDICTLKSGTSLKEDVLNESNGIPYIKVSDMNLVGNEKYIVRANSYADESINEKMLFPKGTVLFPKRGGAIGTNKKRIASKTVCADLNTMGVIPSDKISPLYLYYFFQNIDFATLYNGSSVPQINNTDIAPMEINLISLEEQDNIVTLLEKIDDIVRKRKKELSALDNLIKARFVEMFGDIKTNEYGWEKCTFKDVSTKITDGEHGTVPRVDEGEGYLYFMARNITKEGEIDLSETSFVPREIHEKIYKRCNPEKDDLLLVCVGATIGKCTLVSEIMGEFSMARSVALIKPNKEMVTSNFLINLLRSEAIQNDIDHCSHAAAQAGLYTNMINSLEAFVPPMDLQIEFDTFCEQVYKSKVKVQKALDETQKLFDSQMQQYFG